MFTFSNFHLFCLNLSFTFLHSMFFTFSNYKTVIYVQIEKVTWKNVILTASHKELQIVLGWRGRRLRGRQSVSRGKRLYLPLSSRSFSLLFQSTFSPPRALPIFISYNFRGKTNLLSQSSFIIQPTIKPFFLTRVSFSNAQNNTRTLYSIRKENCPIKRKL